MTHPSDPALDSTREQLLRSAARLFARRPYSQVSLDDILLDAKLTKTAMYRHFESKHALAVALIERRVTMAAGLLEDLTSRKLTGMETLVDTTYTLAAQDTADDYARGGYLLLESVGRVESIRLNLAEAYAAQLEPVVQRAIDEGDIDGRMDAREVSRLLVTLYTGLLSLCDLDDRRSFLLAIEETWKFSLRAFANPERLDYFTAFVRRRTAVAIRRVESEGQRNAPG